MNHALLSDEAVFFGASRKLFGCPQEQRRVGQETHLKLKICRTACRSQVNARTVARHVGHHQRSGDRCCISSSTAAKIPTIRRHPRRKRVRNKLPRKSDRIPSSHEPRYSQDRNFNSACGFPTSVPGQRNKSPNLRRDYTPSI